MPLEEDVLFSDAELYQKSKELQHAASEINAELQRRRRLKSASKGLDTPYIETNDLIIIFEDLLLQTKKYPVSKAFNQRQTNGKKCTDWAKRAIKYYVEPVKLKQAIDYLLKNRNNTGLRLMGKYKILDIESIINSHYYPEAWKKMKNLLNIALSLQDKDKTIADQASEIEVLKTELLRNKSKDWKHPAIELKKSGKSDAEIGRLLSKSRGTISKYMNESSIKLLTQCCKA